MSASAWLQNDSAIIPVQGESLFHSFQSAATLLASVSDNAIVVVGLANQKNWKRKQTNSILKYSHQSEIGKMRVRRCWLCNSAELLDMTKSGPQLYTRKKHTRKTHRVCARCFFILSFVPMVQYPTIFYCIGRLSFISILFPRKWYMFTWLVAAASESCLEYGNFTIARYMLGLKR